MVLALFILVSDAPSILWVKIVMVVVLAILVPGWVSHQDPGDFDRHCGGCDIGIGVGGILSLNIDLHCIWRDNFTHFLAYNFYASKWH